MNPIAAARASLYDAIVDVLAVPVDGFQFEGRVTDTKPDKLAAPWVYIGDSGGATVRLQNSNTYKVAFPVWVVYDGATPQQVRGVDEVIGRLIAACRSAERANVVGHAPQTPDVPDPGRMRAAVLTVELSTASSTFRPNNLMEAVSG